MDGLELGVGQSDHDQRREVSEVRMEEALQIRQQIGYLLRRRRHKGANRLTDVAVA